MTLAHGKLMSREQQLEGDYRELHSRLRTHLKIIAFYGGEMREKAHIQQKFKTLVRHLSSVLHDHWWFVMIQDFLLKYLGATVAIILIIEPFFSGHLSGYAYRIHELMAASRELSLENEKSSLQSRGSRSFISEANYIEFSGVVTPTGNVLVDDLTLRVESSSVFISSSENCSGLISYELQQNYPEGDTEIKNSEACLHEQDPLCNLSRKVDSSPKESSLESPAVNTEQQSEPYRDLPAKDLRPLSSTPSLKAVEKKKTPGNNLKNIVKHGFGSFNGPIPDEIGFLKELHFISLNSNSFTGRISHSIGNLLNLYWLDLADNELQGPIPISSGSVPGLDKLHHAKHFHLGKNNLSGNIPPQLFSSEMALIHLYHDW
ncbi:ABC transporter D family member [Arachis hypogaea]|nr:ABC transporter D family member [Arachis hypogaea]